MELVYLWVEEYKNIHRQGFNFSPRFNCKYDDKTNELTIDKNDDYIADFFGDNINVTAIVGKNGSGKSNVLEALINIFIYKNIIENNSSKKYKLLLLCINENKFNIKSLNILAEEVSFLYQNKNILSIKECYNNTSHILFDYTLNYSQSFIDNIRYSNLAKDTNTQLKIIPERYNESIDIKHWDNDLYRNILNFKIKNDRKIDKIDKIFNPIRCKLTINKGMILKGDNTNNNGLDIQKYENYKYFESVKNNLNDSEKIILYNKLYIIEKVYFLSLSSNKKLLNENILNFKTSKFHHKFDIEGLLSYFNDDLSNIIRNDDNLPELCEIKKAIFFHNDVKNNSNIDSYFNRKIDISRFKNLSLHIPTWININFFDKRNLSLDSLSYGQKTIIRIYYIILNHLESSSIDYSIYHLYFDEVELGFHPNWQKLFINELLVVLNNLYPKKKFHLFFCSHSPFLLSDIPKQNIIFLDTDDNGKCKVVDGLKEKKETFGANIHTLLSDSFFMEGGLMGEFAKGKIDHIIAILNKDKLTKTELKECEQIISIIGEPIIKKQLQRMLDSKRLKKVDEIDIIKKDMRKLEHRLRELEERE